MIFWMMPRVCYYVLRWKAIETARNTHCTETTILTQQTQWDTVGHGREQGRSFMATQPSMLFGRLEFVLASRARHLVRLMLSGPLLNTLSDHKRLDKSWGSKKLRRQGGATESLAVVVSSSRTCRQPCHAVLLTSKRRGHISNVLASSAEQVETFCIVSISTAYSLALSSQYFCSCRPRDPGDDT